MKKYVSKPLKIILISVLMFSCAGPVWLNSSNAKYKSQVEYESSNFVGSQMILMSVFSDNDNTIMTFKIKLPATMSFSSSTFIYNWQDINQSFRIKNIQGGKLQLDKFYKFEAGTLVDVIFERVSSGIEKINFKEIPSAAGTVGFEILGVQINNPKQSETTPKNTFNFFENINKNTPTNKSNCLVCGNKGSIFCNICAGRGTLQKSKQVRTPVSKSRLVTRYRTNYKGQSESYLATEYYTDYENKTEYYTDRCTNCSGTGKLKCSNTVAHPAKVTDK